MTATSAGPGASGEGHDEPADASLPATLPPWAEAVVRHRRVKARQRRVTTWQIVASVVFVALLAGLAWIGYDASLRVGGGTDSRVTDPAAPGYVAEPRPTPNDLYVVTDDAGKFASALLVVPDASGQGGTTVPLPPSFIVPAYEDSPPMFLRDVFAEGGIDGIRDRLGIALQFRISSAETVPPAALAAMAGNEPLEVTNVDNLVDPGTEVVRYPAGTITLQPDEIAGFLAYEGGGDPAPNQALRARTVWEALFARAEGATLDGVPAGEVSEGSSGPGFPAAMEALLAGDVTFDGVPMIEVPVPDSYYVAWMPDAANLNDFVARVVPLPETPAPGIRVPMEVLNGTTSTTAVGAAVPSAVRAGGEVVLVGNADSFDVATTTVEYTVGGKAAAEAVAGELGVTATAPGKSIDNGAVRIVLGADRAG